MNKKIGIVGWKTGDNSFGVTIPYIHYFSKFGEVQIISVEQSLVQELDLLILPGGKDVNPLRYGERPSYHNSDINPFLESFDKFMLPQYLEIGTPVFGICRGFQSLNVYFGGSLTQHHIHAYSTKNRGEIVHDLELIKQNIPGLNVPKNKIEANSIHHQVVTSEDLAMNLIPLLSSDKQDDVIEGFKHSFLPVAGVQYHPEELYFEPFSDYVISKLLKKEPII